MFLTCRVTISAHFLDEQESKGFTSLGLKVFSKMFLTCRVTNSAHFLDKQESRGFTSGVKGFQPESTRPSQAGKDF